VTGPFRRPPGDDPWRRPPEDQPAPPGDAGQGDPGPYGPPPRRRPGRLPPTARHTRPLPEDSAAGHGPGDTDVEAPEDDDPAPSKITVTRVAAWRARRLTRRGAQAFHRAASADGADRSGLTALTYAWMANYASDATLAVALANTLFFSAASAESKSKVALYLLITVAPFAVIAPVIGPLLDRLQQGRRVAMAVSTAGQGALAVVLALYMHTWALYPAALGIMVLSKSFGVLKAAVTPRVLPPGIGLVTTNSRLTVFGLVASGVAGGIGAGVAWLFGSPGAAWLTAAICVAGVWLCLRIPAWVEVTEGEVPTRILPVPGVAGTSTKRSALTRDVLTALWANGTIRSLTGFLMLFAAFVVKNETEGAPGDQLLLLGVVGAAAGAGGFVGNFVGARQRFGRPRVLMVVCLVLALAAVVLAAVLTGLVTAAVTALVAATTSALLKVCLDAVVQRDLPEAGRASAFGRSETILQLSWVFGGALGVLLPPTWWIGFTVIGAVVALGTVQTVLTARGSSLVPRMRR
jgi:MFS family permease